MASPPSRSWARLPVRASGRLGNLLFQYSLVLYARNMGREAYLEARRSTPEHIRDLLSLVEVPAAEIAYSELPVLLRSSSWAVAAHDRTHRLAFRGVAAAERRGLLPHRVPDFDDDSSLTDLADATLASGYFQSTDLVDAVFESLSSRLAPSLKSQFLQSRPETVLHVRMGDYADLPEFDVLSTDYYSRGLVASGGTTTDAVVIVTDSPERAAERFGSFNIAEITRGNMLDDFLRIAQAERKVISNSTFAWWAARLGEMARRGTVIGPRPWHSGAFQAELYRHDWAWVESDVT